jgi:hypothetical protein
MGMRRLKSLKIKASVKVAPIRETRLSSGIPSTRADTAATVVNREHLHTIERNRGNPERAMP